MNLRWNVADMGKAPAFQFYPSDWLEKRVLRMSDGAQGVYLRLLCFMWKDSTGQYSIENNDKTIAKLLGISSRKWKKHKAEIQWMGDPILIDRSGLLLSKRLQKEKRKQVIKSDKARESANKRWMRTQCERIKNASASHEPSNALQSSSPSSKISSSNEEQALPVYLEKKLGHFSDQIQDENIIESIIDLCRWYEKNLKTFNGWQFVQQNCKCHPQALVDVLRVPKYYIENDMVIKKGPWAIVNKILPSKIKNYNAQDTVKAHKELTAQMKNVAPEIKEIANKLFGG